MMGRFRKDGGGPRRPAGGLGREPAARRGCLPQWRAGPWPLGGSSGRHGADRSGSGVAPRPRECDGARGQPHGFGAERRRAAGRLRKSAEEQEKVKKRTRAYGAPTVFHSLC